MIVSVGSMAKVSRTIIVHVCIFGPEIYISMYMCIRPLREADLPLC